MNKVLRLIAFAFLIFNFNAARCQIINLAEVSENMPTAVHGSGGDTGDFDSFVFAVTYGTPAAFNASFLFFYERLGFQFTTSGIYVFAYLLDEITCSDIGSQAVADYPFMAEVNIMAKLFEGYDHIIALGIMGGTSVTRPKPLWMHLSNRYFYTGPSLHIVSRGLFLQIGYGFAQDVVTKTNFRLPIYQLGINFNF